MAELLVGSNQDLFFDPFAEQEALPHDPMDSLAEIFERYENDDVEHDYTADELVRDVWALMEDAKFQDNLSAVYAMSEFMALACQHDHSINAANESYVDTLSGHGKNSENDHSHEGGDKHDSKTCKSCKSGKKCDKR